MHPVQLLPLTQIKANPRNTRTHSKKQIAQIAASIQAFGYTVPVLVNEDHVLLAGHGRIEAARLLGLAKVPAIISTGLSPAKQRALMLADNKITANAGWDRERLAEELPELASLLGVEDLDISLTGFDPPEIDALLADFDNVGDPLDDVDPDLMKQPGGSRSGDLWRLGNHRLLCGDARSETGLELLMEGSRAAMAFLDPPYNLRVRSIVGRGRTKHREFAMASGEMTQPEFQLFLTQVLANARRVSCEGAVHYICMDWKHIGDLIAAGGNAYAQMLNLVVWVKPSGGQGSFYRSQHELIGVFRVGAAPHLNNIELGRHGRTRSNVWRYPGANTFRVGRMEDLRTHPTVKPLMLVADAIKDCTRRHEIVLDTFSGSGTTLLAAERVGRIAHAMEIDPVYVDVAVRRWQAFTGKDAIHTQTGRTFDETVLDRSTGERLPASNEKGVR